MSLTSVRDKAWVFNALWSASDLPKKCTLCIPLTCIFNEGLPFKILATDSSGNVRKVDLDKVEPVRLSNSSVSFGVDMRKLLSFRQLLEDYAFQNRYHVQQAEPKLAKVYYIDGKIEDLTAKQLDGLMRNKSWLLQVLMIQGFIPTLSTLKGMYSKKPMVRSKIDQDKTATADQLSASIAKYIERAYAQQSSELLGGAVSSTRLKVENLTCCFCLDQSDPMNMRTVFLHAEYTAAEVEGDRHGVEEYMKQEQLSREQSAAENVKSQLLSLLLHSYKAGMSIDNIFKHFDPQGNGYMDVDMLITGLSSLGMGVTYPVGETLLELMGGVGASFLTSTDFQAFLTMHIENDSLYSSTNIKAKLAGSPKRNAVGKKATSSPSARVKNKDLLPPEKDWQSINKSFADIGASQSSSWYEEGEDTAEQVLPMPEEAYTTRPVGTQGSADMLPTWARNRSRKALNTLQAASSRKRREDSSLLYDASSHATKPRSTSSDKQKRNKTAEKKKGVSVLNLQSVHDGQLAEQMLLSSKDDLLHLENGVVTTYRILDGAEIARSVTRTKEKTDSLRYHSVMSIRQKNLAHVIQAHEEEFGGGEVHSEEKLSADPDEEGELSFTLVVVPDLTMTLDTLQLHMESLLHSFPFARIVLVGLLGLPNTIWPAHWVINSDLQARTIAHLLHSLQDSGRLFFHHGLVDESKQNLLLMGFGLGSFHLSRFLCQHLKSFPSSFAASIRCVIPVNGFNRVSKKFRSKLDDFRRALQSANVSEAHGLITSLHFDDDYLARNDRHECLTQFWSTRRNLTAGSTTDAVAIKTLSGFVGLLEQLRGIIVTVDEFDGAMMLVQTDIPVVVIQSTEDVLVDPKNASLYSANQLPPERQLVSDVVDALEINAVHLIWLKAGHEVLQERTPFILGAISSLAKLLGVKAHKVEEKSVEQSESYTDDLFDVLSAGSFKFGQEPTEMEKDLLPDALVLEEMDFSQPFAVAAQPVGSPQLEPVMTEVKAVQPIVVDEEDADESKGDSPQQKVKRTQMHLERKKRQLKQNRQQQLEVYYQHEREEKEKALEHKETKLMTKEDQWSRYAADYALQCEISEISKRLARDKVAQLKKLRNEEAVKKAEEERAFQRSVRIEQRRKLAANLVKKIEEEELTLKGMKEGGYDLPTNTYDINGALEASHRILRDLMECRQKYVEAISRQNLLEEKHELFKKQLATLENEEKRLRRAIRLIEINPSIVGKELNAETQLIDLRGSLYSKQTTLQEMSAMAKERAQQLYAANRNVQLLKLASHERDRLMLVRLEEINKMEITLNDRLKEQKMVKENLVIQKDRLRVQLITHQKRLDLVEKELNRIRNHKGKLVDTDVWVEGVVQRADTKTLKKKLKGNIVECNALKKDVMGELEVIRHEIFEVTERIAQAKRDVDKVTNVGKLLNRSYKKFSATPVVEIAKNFKKLKNKTEQLEMQRSRSTDIDKIFMSANNDSLVDKLRMKESEIRTKDERQFVGLDLIIHPEEYIHLSSVEAEQMQFDADYQSTLSKSDIERILKLPEAVNLALPFLHTAEEVNAHRILNKFIRNLDDNHFSNRDFLSGSSGEASFKQNLSHRTSDGLDGAGQTAKTLEEAEMVHDILIRESLRDRLRASFDDEKLTDMERQWIAMDKVLCPHVFGLDDIENDVVKQPHVLDLIKPAHINAMTSSSITPARLKGKKLDYGKQKLLGDKEGDIYGPLREYFQNKGDELFTDERDFCPFSRTELLRIHATKVTELKKQDEQDVKALLMKYFVSDEESVLGHAKLSALLHVSSEISSILQRAESKLEEEMKANKLDFDKMTQQLASDALTERSQLSMESDAVASFAKADTEDIKRIWGSWSQVHPASQGAESQRNHFMLSNFDASRDHPASYGIRDEVDAEGEDIDENEEGDEVNSLLSENVSPRARGMTMLKGTSSVRSGQMSKLMGRLHDPKSNFFIAESVEDLAQQDSRLMRGKICLVQEKEPMTLFEIQGSTIQTRQSRSHYFTIAEKESLRILELTVSIVFQGVFSTTGYRLGRMAASLFRLPREQQESAQIMPISVGYTPYDTISPNLPDSLGRLIIYHKPKDRPIPPGTFQLIIGSAATTVYSIVVHAKFARTALPVVDELVDQAKKMQSRLPVCLEELDGIAESLRLAERKLIVCEKMIQEAESETERCQYGMRVLGDKIERDDEEMTLMEDERRDLQRELSILEIEYSQWARIFASRTKEKEDIKEGVQAMYKFRREREEEKDSIQKKLEASRRDLPASIRILRTMTEAVNVAMSLNTDVVGISEEAGAAATGDWGGIRLSTPAEDIRRVVKQFGFAALMFEEQQWCLLDQQLHPHKYEWLREKEEKEKQERILMGKKLKDEKFNPALDPFKLSKSEIEYILETPFSMLNRREVIVRKLLTKYHDDAEHMKKAISAVAYSFDPHLAERVRAKNPKAYSKEELEWSTIDRQLHPEIWKYYVHRSENFLDRHSKEATLAADNGKKRKSTLKKAADSVKLFARLAANNRNKDSGTLSPVAESANAIMQNVVNLEGEDINAVIERLQQTTHIKLRTAEQAAKNNVDWECHLSKEEIIKVWKTPRHFLKTDDERRIYKLLQKYNGSYASYLDVLVQSNRRKGKVIKSGSHIQWEKLGKLVSKDTDFRARQLLREIDRAANTRNEWIHSDVLHANDQKFPTKVLRTHLEDALDNLLIEQIKDRERADKYRIDQEDSSDSDDSRAEVPEGLEVDGADEQETEILSKVRKRADRRAKRKEKMNAIVESEEELVLRTKKILQTKKTGQELADMLLESQLGTGSCLACRFKRCRWKTNVDVEVCTARKIALDGEIERIRLDRDSSVFESDISLSAQLGGNRIFRRHDLLDELNDEIRELQIRIELANVDKELHDAYATRKEFFESRELHGYRVILWTNNARKALEARQSRLVALSVAKEVVADILDSMLEGWVFGERQSQFQALGYVPSIKKDGFIRAGQEQINSVVTVVKKMKDRADRKRQGILDDESRRGQMLDKAYEIEQSTQSKQKALKVARDGNEHEHLLDETENTLKFGLFMLTLMYFRAMTFLKREQKSWSAEDDEIGVKDRKKSSKVMTDERMRMIDEENKVAMRQKKVDLILAKSLIGEARRKEREANERKEAIVKMQAVIRRQKLEVASISLIQKFYRGHLGRKAAKRWALKRAELGAMNALLNATAIAIQRVYRGYKARVYAVVKRTEMAQFIALMRVQESAQDEEVYWQTHPWSRFKRRQKDWVNDRLEKYRARKLMGGARLSAEEQAELEGKTLEEIKREIEGLDDDDAPDFDLPDEDGHGPSFKHGVSAKSGKSGKSGKSSKSRRELHRADSDASMLSGMGDDDDEDL